MFEPAVNFWNALLPWLLGISALLSLGFFAGIMYIVLSMNKLKAAEKAKDEGSSPLEGAPAVSEKPSFKEPEGNVRWKRILDKASSQSESDWRLAIIEADVILDEMMGKMGYHGKDLGEKLKSVEKSDFETIELAWEAHKIRNRIAHMGGEYPLSERETRRVISLYKQVFEEFEYI
jgi:hypothetical protein